MYKYACSSIIYQSKPLLHSELIKSESVGYCLKPTFAQQASVQVSEQSLRGGTTGSTKSVMMTDTSLVSTL